MSPRAWHARAEPPNMDMSPDDVLDEIVAERTKKSPDFPKLVEEAAARRAGRPPRSPTVLPSSPSESWLRPPTDPRRRRTIVRESSESSADRVDPTHDPARILGKSRDRVCTQNLGSTAERRRGSSPLPCTFNQLRIVSHPDFLGASPRNPPGAGGTVELVRDVSGT